MDRVFEVTSPYQPAGDQPQAIEKLVEGLMHGLVHQTLLGVTGSVKLLPLPMSFKQLQRPTLILAPNKTLAAQFYGEMKGIFSA